jgi:hypothetical protein
MRKLPLKLERRISLGNIKIYKAFAGSATSNLGTPNERSLKMLSHYISARIAYLKLAKSELAYLRKLGK